MTLLSGRKSDDHLCQEYEKIFKDILQRICMEGQIESIKYAKGIKGDEEHTSGFQLNWKRYIRRTVTKFKKSM